MSSSDRPDPRLTADPFAGGGAMGEAMRALDWSATPLGPVETWSSTLRTAVNLCLASPAPTMLVWGPEHIQLYNDALAPHMGPKHPGALGRPYAESFAEIWDDLQGPLLRKVYDQAESVHVEDAPVFFHRAVPDEEMYWTFSWSPVRAEDGSVVGAFHPAGEVTSRVLLERRLRLLRDLAASAGQASSVQECLQRAAAVLASAPLDVPFGALYRVVASGDGWVAATARRAATFGVPAPSRLFTDEVDLGGAGYSPWQLAAATASDRPRLVTELDLQHGDLTAPTYPELPTSAVVLPILRPDRPLPAALLVAGVSARRPVDAELLDFLHLLSAQLATALSTARLLEAQHRVALTLQRSLLPDSESSEALEVAARYLPGSAEAEVGGDWYDVVHLPAGRTALVIGDVMGRGVRAAAVMGQLRAAVRAYSHMDLPPERVLALLDRLVVEMSQGSAVGQIVTCIYAVYDSAEQTATVASAGHPPPVLLEADGARLLQTHPDPPLGVGAAEFRTTVVGLRPGQGLLLYTDGLVETRTEDLDVGLTRLVEAVAGSGADDLERTADAALGARVSSELADDIALLAVRVPVAQDRPVRGRSLDLTGVPRPVRAARLLTDAVLQEWGLPLPVVDTAALVCAELVTNAVTHTPGPQQLRLRLLDRRVVIEVSDTDQRPPQRLTARADDFGEGGRGLVVVSTLASDWGVRPRGTGKIVWAEIPVGRG